MRRGTSRSFCSSIIRRSTSACRIWTPSAPGLRSGMAGLPAHAHAGFYVFRPHPPSRPPASGAAYHFIFSVLTSHQVAFDLTTSTYIPGTHEWPDYSLVTVTGNDIVILQRSFLYEGPNSPWMASDAQTASSEASCSAEQMWLDRYRGLLCDLDGCLVAGGRLLPGARELVGLCARSIGHRLEQLDRHARDACRKLARLNLPIAPERIVLAGATAVEFFAATVARRGSRSTGRRPSSAMRDRWAWWSIMTVRILYC